jgi:hypothetical protein
MGGVTGRQAVHGSRRFRRRFRSRSVVLPRSGGCRRVRTLLGSRQVESCWRGRHVFAEPAGGGNSAQPLQFCSSHVSLRHCSRRSGVLGRCASPGSLGVAMRALLFIVILLAAATTVLCAAGYFGAAAQQGETGAELRKSQASGKALTDAEIAVHLSRIGQQGRNWGIAGLMSGATGIAALMALIIGSKMRST